MSGNSASYEQRGLIPRVLAALLSRLRSTPGLSSWSLSLSYLEVRTALHSSLQFSTASVTLHGAVQCSTLQGGQYEVLRTLPLPSVAAQVYCKLVAAHMG
jgi:hypothetical protein